MGRISYLEVDTTENLYGDDFSSSLSSGFNAGSSRGIAWAMTDNDWIRMLTTNLGRTLKLVYRTKEELSEVEAENRQLKADMEKLKADTINVKAKLFHANSHIDYLEQRLECEALKVQSSEYQLDYVRHRAERAERKRWREWLGLCR